MKKLARPESPFSEGTHSHLGAPGGSTLGKRGAVRSEGKCLRLASPCAQGCSSPPTGGQEAQTRARCPGCCSLPPGQRAGRPEPPAEGAQSGKFSRRLTWVRPAAQPGETRPANGWRILRAPAVCHRPARSDLPGPHSLLSNHVHTGSAPSHGGDWPKAVARPGLVRPRPGWLCWLRPPGPALVPPLCTGFLACKTGSLS